MTSGTAIVQVGVVVIAVLGLWIGARALVDATVRVARRFGVGELTIGLTIVAMGTSTPELVVTVDAALAGLGEIGVGNIIGSNAYNLAFILGAVSLLRVIPVERSLVHRDGAALVLSTLVGAAALFDRTVTGVEGALLAGCSSRTPPTSSAMSARRARSTPSTRTRGSRERFRTVSRSAAATRCCSSEGWPSSWSAGTSWSRRRQRSRDRPGSRTGRSAGRSSRRGRRRRNSPCLSSRCDGVTSGCPWERRREQRVQRARNYGDRGLPPAARGRRRGNRDGPLADSRHGRHGRRAVVRTAALPH